MMLNIKFAELIENYPNVFPIGLILGFLFIYQLLFLLRFEFEVVEAVDPSSIIFFLDFSNISIVKTEFLNLNCAFTNIKIIAFALFSNYLFHFMLAGLVLLLAMIAAIVLTIQKHFISKNQNIYNQVLKDCNSTFTAYV